MEKATLVGFVMLFLVHIQLQTMYGTRVEITRYELCSEEQYAIEAHLRIATENRGQFLYGNATIPFPLDQKVGVNVSIQTFFNGKFRLLHTIYEKYLCRAANIYLGDHWYNISRAMKIPAKKCPIPSGYYEGNRVPMNLNQLPLQGFPLGALRFVINVINSSSPATSFLCIMEEVQYVNN